MKKSKVKSSRTVSVEDVRSMLRKAGIPFHANSRVPIAARFTSGSGACVNVAFGFRKDQTVDLFTEMDFGVPKSRIASVVKFLESINTGMQDAKFYICPNCSRVHLFCRISLVNVGSASQLIDIIRDYLIPIYESTIGSVRTISTGTPAKAISSQQDSASDEKAA